MNATFVKGGKRYEVLDHFRVDGAAVDGDIKGHVIDERTSLAVTYFDSFDGLVASGYLKEVPNHEKEPLLSDLEIQALRMSGELANLLARIIGDGSTREGDWREAVSKIHDIQHMIAAQAAARAFPNEFRLLGEVGAWRAYVERDGDRSDDSDRVGDHSS